MRAAIAAEAPRPGASVRSAALVARPAGRCVGRVAGGAHQRRRPGRLGGRLPPGRWLARGAGAGAGGLAHHAARRPPPALRERRLPASRRHRRPALAHRAARPDARDRGRRQRLPSQRRRGRQPAEGAAAAVGQRRLCQLRRQRPDRFPARTRETDDHGRGGLRRRRLERAGRWPHVGRDTRRHGRHRPGRHAARLDLERRPAGRPLQHPARRHSRRGRPVGPGGALRRHPVEHRLLDPARLRRVPAARLRAWRSDRALDRRPLRQQHPPAAGHRPTGPVRPARRACRHRAGPDQDGRARPARSRAGDRAALLRDAVAVEARPARLLVRAGRGARELRARQFPVRPRPGRRHRPRRRHEHLHPRVPRRAPAEPADGRRGRHPARRQRRDRQCVGRGEPWRSRRRDAGHRRLRTPVERVERLAAGTVRDAQLRAGRPVVCRSPSAARLLQRQRGDQPRLGRRRRQRADAVGLGRRQLSHLLGQLRAPGRLARLRELLCQQDERRFSWLLVRGLLHAVVRRATAARPKACIAAATMRRTMRIRPPGPTSRRCSCNRARRPGPASATARCSRAATRSASSARASGRPTPR